MPFLSALVFYPKPKPAPIVSTNNQTISTVFSVQVPRRRRTSGERNKVNSGINAAFSDLDRDLASGKGGAWFETPT
jgi:hypothetical protein